MVKLIASLIVVSLATSSVVAFSDLYERELQLKSRELGQDEELVVRDAPKIYADRWVHFRNGLALGPPHHPPAPGSNKLLIRDTLDDLETRDLSYIGGRRRLPKGRSPFTGANLPNGVSAADFWNNVLKNRDIEINNGRLQYSGGFLTRELPDVELLERELGDEELLERELSDEELVVRDLSYVNRRRHLPNGPRSPFAGANSATGGTSSDFLNNALKNRHMGIKNGRLQYNGGLFGRELTDEELLERDVFDDLD